MNEISFASIHLRDLRLVIGAGLPGIGRGNFVSHKFPLTPMEFLDKPQQTRELIDKFMPWIYFRPSFLGTRHAKEDAPVSPEVSPPISRAEIGTLQSPYQTH